MRLVCESPNVSDPAPEPSHQLELWLLMPFIIDRAWLGETPRPVSLTWDSTQCWIATYATPHPNICSGAR